MRKVNLFYLILIMLVLGFYPTGLSAQAHSSSPLKKPAPSPYDVIEAVNNFRQENGLPPYTVNTILMSIAQAHSEYMASIGSWTHLGVDGSRPYQRALEAGYPVAGDLSLGGWFSENVGSGLNLSVEGIIKQWKSDAPHLETMLSVNHQDIGAGVAAFGNIVYYTIDTGLSTSGTPRPDPGTTIPTSIIVPASTEEIVIIITVTPKTDGSLIHVVQRGETLWSISIAYGFPIEEIRLRNYLSVTQFIYPGDILIIRLPFTPTPTQPTPTLTPRPTITSIPTSTGTTSATPLPPTLTPAPNLSASTGILTVGIIFVVALLAAGGITLLGSHARRS